MSTSAPHKIFSGGNLRMAVRRFDILQKIETHAQTLRLVGRKILGLRELTVARPNPYSYQA